MPELDEAVRAGRLVADGKVLKEGGDIVMPLKAGLITPASIKGDLFDLCRGATAGRRSADEITLFKSVGKALEDFAAARLVVQRLPG